MHTSRKRITAKNNYVREPFTAASFGGKIYVTRTSNIIEHHDADVVK